ncbi:hypothetical protein B0H14DRAFT_3016917 [Mycena olivaceomarginata]|nr:hypothetical protein B0H14DRAFT_3016917 [Mycena olivaceomarginata]
MSQDNDPVEWANRVGIAGAVLYFYDWKSNITPPRGGTFMSHIFLYVRMASATYQTIIIVQIPLDSWTSKKYPNVPFYFNLDFNCLSSCAEWNNVAQAFDTIFQLLCVVGITSRVISVWNRDHTRIFMGLLLPIGLLGPILNVAVPNPPVFPRCRVFDPTPPSKYMKPHRRSRIPGSLAQFMGVEGYYVVFLTIEAISVQVRTNARNFIVPFLDSLGAITFLRFLLDFRELALSDTTKYTATFADYDR